ITGDVVTDFDLGEGDRIDVSALDADTTVAGDQAFAFFSERDVFSGAFANAAALFFEQSTYTLFGNVDADGAADFSIRLAGVDTLTPGAFLT
ncbi:MAG: type I secretion C-terminal target domain-containing protein, partial [Enhydrobacter sp.]|nr:type I secretion C-terminal target domain-containing protein [Enhydrobacter sp.]